MEATIETAWIRTRKTGNLWEVSGRELERTLSNPDDYELLEKDEAGNYLGEEGSVVIAAPAPEPIKLVLPRSSGKGPKTPEQNAIDNEDDF